MQNRVLFQAYGYEGILAECRFALLRLAAMYTNRNNCPQVVVYTDQPDYFRPFETEMPLLLIPVSSHETDVWKGSINFVHRVKIEVIRDFFTRFDGRVLYADTDTFCLQRPDELFAAINSHQIIMHTNEGNLRHPQNLHLKKWKRFLLGHPTLLQGNFPAIDTVMWNAGIIGMQQSHAPLLNEVLSLTDSLYPLFSRHTIEQFSFCYTFQKEDVQILPAEQYFFHYWSLKELRQVLISFFHKYKDASFDELVASSQALQPEVILKSKLLFERADPVTKLVRKLLSRKWSPDVSV